MASAAKGPATKLIGETRHGETIELGNHDFYDFVGGGSHLENCMLDICGTGFDLVDATLVGCRVKVRRRISNKRFLNAIFDNCRFEGHLVGCRFGFRHGESDNAGATFRGCDFSTAILQLCDFFKGDVDSVIWPSWPNVVILDPARNKRDWLSIAFPPGLRVTQKTVGLEPIELAFRPPLTSPIDEEPRAITLNLADCKEVNPETIWPLIQDKPYIVFGDKGSKQRV
jgi:hypothetical protein